jgi:diketogulonate reductase-like aldo/keto reductase
MEQRTMGGVPGVAVIGQGTWQIDDTGAVEDTLRRGIEFGMTHVDTAELYPGAEVLVGRAIADCRERIFLVSKVMPSNASREGTITACERSLKLLGTDYLDAYLLHWHEGDFPIAETMEAMMVLRTVGKIRHIGVSNFEVDDLIEAKRVLGDVPLICNQVRYALDDRAIEADVIPYCAENNIAVVGYSPFGTGSFPEPGSVEHGILEGIGLKHERTPRQVALRFLTREAHLFAIPKASTIAHVEENALGQGFTLDSDDIAAIDKAFPAEGGVR